MNKRRSQGQQSSPKEALMSQGGSAPLPSTHTPWNISAAFFSSLLSEAAERLIQEKRTSQFNSTSLLLCSLKIKRVYLPNHKLYINTIPVRGSRAAAVALAGSTEQHASPFPPAPAQPRWPQRDRRRHFHPAPTAGI